MIEMKKRLDDYRKEFMENIWDETAIEFRTFKENFFKSLQVVLYQLILLKDNTVRDNKIITIYNWYKNRMDFFYKLNDIKEKTTSSGEAPDPFFEKFVKSEMYLAMNYPRDFEHKHRTLPDRVLKTTLKELERNSIDREKYINKELDIMNFIEKKLKDYEELIISSSESDTRSTKYSDINEVPRLLDFIDEKTDKKMKYDEKRSFKSTYAYLNPSVDYHQLDFERRIRKQKEEEVAESRYQCETLKYMLQYGEKKGQQNSKLNEKFEKKAYIKNFDIDKHHPKKLIAEKAKEEENNKGKAVDNKKIPNSNTENLKKKRYSRISIVDLEETEVFKNMSNRNNAAKEFDFGKIDEYNPQSQEIDEKRANFSKVKNLSSIAVDYKHKIPDEIFVKIENNKDTFPRQNDSVYDGLEEMPSESVCIRNRDEIFRVRNSNSELLDIKSVDGKKHVENDQKILSLFGDRNFDLTKNKLFNKPEKAFRKTKSIEIKNNVFLRNSANLLEQKNIYSKYLEAKDNYKIKKILEKEDSNFVPKTKLDNMLFPPIENKETFNRYYLPQGSGMGLKE